MLVNVANFLDQMIPLLVLASFILLFVRFEKFIGIPLGYLADQGPGGYAIALLIMLIGQLGALFISIFGGTWLMDMRPFLHLIT